LDWLSSSYITVKAFGLNTSMNNHFNFGVIIPTYNSKSFIIEALESIFRQTLLPSEVMISDDGSSDATAQIVRSLSSDAPVKVNFITNPRPSGISANYLNALRHLSPCDYVVVADHDDTWLPQRLQVFNDVFHSEPSATLACCDSLFTDRSLRLTGGSVRGGGKAVTGALFTPSANRQLLIISQRWSAMSSSYTSFSILA
jgi:glycosyltransferase involved in cell wall biosynthesis